MLRFLSANIVVLPLLIATPAASQATDPGVEMAFMVRTMIVTLLNEGANTWPLI
jgi:hypothetical protein